MAQRLEGKKVLVIGLGMSGRSAAKFLLEQGAIVTGVDQKQEALDHREVVDFRQRGMKTMLETSPIDLKVLDLVVVSPGISSTHPLYRSAISAGKEMIGEVELACRYIKQKFIGITGTNGKTTVTLLIAHVLNQAGLRAKALGNVGVPIASEVAALQGSTDVIVAELSSFQLDTMYSKVIDAGVILNITPDHLDRYGSMEEYAKSKIHMKDCLKPQGVLYVEDKSYQEFLPLFGNFKPRRYGYTKDCDISTDKMHLSFQENIEYLLPLEYRGRVSHDLENMMAAYALCRDIGVSAKQFFEALKSFAKPSHRIEFVRNINGVAYYDDSKGTNIDAVIRAVNSIPGEILLIAGGVDKGAAYTPWIDAFGDKVKSICAIGQAAPKIKQDLSHAMQVEICESLGAAIAFATKVAKSGQNVLLSPGCSSYDMFRDYAHRGDEFKRIVNELNQGVR